MRIISGKWKGRQLSKLPNKFQRSDLRPTMDRVRETLFNILVHGEYVNPIGSRVLDLFSGTGSIGFEALSRGADYACFVDSNQNSINLLNENIKKLETYEKATILKRNATKLGKNIEGKFNLVFMDPPYGKGLGELAISSALEENWIAYGATVVWEENSNIVVPKELILVENRLFGSIQLNFLTYS